MNQTGEYSIIGGVLRTPLFSASQYENLTADKLKAIMKLPIVRDGISLTSPDFLSELEKWEKDEITDDKKLRTVLETAYKYASRLSARCTPFGLFSNVNYIHVEETETQEEFENVLNPKVQSFSRLDLCAVKLIVERLLQTTSLKKSLSFSANNTFFKMGDTYRYYEPKEEGNRVEFTISKVNYHVVLEKILAYCSTPKTLPQLVSFLVDEFEDFNQNSAEELIFDLENENMLFTNLVGIYASEDPLDCLISILEKAVNDDVELSVYIQNLKQIQAALANETSILEQLACIRSALDNLAVYPKAKDLLHVDSVKKELNQLGLIFSEKDRKIVLEIKELLAGFKWADRDPFKHFKEQFTRRYGQKKMPLLFILDPEFGIGYSQYPEHLDVDPLQRGIPTGRQVSQNKEEFTQAELTLLDLVVESIRDQKDCIDLKAHGSRFPNNGPVLDSSFSIFGSVIGQGRYMLESFVFNSAGKLINRFAHVDERLKTLCETIIGFEKEPGKIKAELYHNYDYKTESVFKSNALNTHEIPCVSPGSDGNTRQISLKDIMVSVRHDRVVLTSTAHQKEIIPILSHPKNYHSNAIDLYKFLADFQLQYETSFLAFQWGSLLNRFKHFPRLTYDNFVLSPKMWMLSKTDVDSLSGIREWQLQHKLPQYVYLTTRYHDDRKILIDFENEYAINVLTKDLGRYGKVYLSETLLDEDAPFKDQNKKPYHNEIIVPFLKYKHETIRGHTDHTFEMSKSIRTHFFPGDEWLYFKVYCNHMTVDNLLKDRVRPFVDDLLGKRWISSAFFIRYYDDDFHLRIRFLVSNKPHLSGVISAFNELLRPYTEVNIVYKIMLDTYERELDRYGGETIDLCESIFFQDSLAVMNFLPLSTPENQIAFAIKGINHYFDNFQFSLDVKLGVLENIYQGFFNEFGIDKVSRKKMDSRYRDYRNLFFKSLVNNNIEQDEINLEIDKILDCRSSQVGPLVAELIAKTKSVQKVQDICASLIHMFLNRLHRGNHRKQEMILYYFMHKNFISVKAIARKKMELTS